MYLRSARTRCRTPEQLNLPVRVKVNARVHCKRYCTRRYISTNRGMGIIEIGGYFLSGTFEFGICIFVLVLCMYKQRYVFWFGDILVEENTISFRLIDLRVLGHRHVLYDFALLGLHYVLNSCIFRTFRLSFVNVSFVFHCY